MGQYFHINESVIIPNPRAHLFITYAIFSERIALFTPTPGVNNENFTKFAYELNA